MPGRLVMDQHAMQGHDGLKKDKDLNQQMAQTNGSHPSPPSNGNGDGIVHADFANRDGANPSIPLTNGSSHSGAGNGQGEEDLLPPELEHWADSYTPMGKLLERVAQQCYSDLTETVDAMADIPVQQHAPTVNGAGPHSIAHAAPDSSAASVEKKLKLMNFAQLHKDRFIKALVLSDWARNMEDMDKLIELRVWLQQQDEAATAVAGAIVQMKHNLIPAKMPNPNIQGALELLSTGKAPWMPDLGYIPPKPLNARQLLKTLQDMNFALSIRLNVDEELPLNFRNYSIANGRATFVVPHEFEVDLAVADEDPTSPFYFIDLRFLFSASPQISDGAVRANIEGKVNEVLAADGLAGCYSYLHNFVLTHRTNILRRQAFEMMRGKWSDCIRVETVHRDFVVHYWTGQPGGKSWIHVGTLSSANSFRPSKKASQQPRLGIRWVKEGQDMPDAEVDMNDPQYTMEQILEQVIAGHIHSRLRKIADRLRKLTGEKSAVKVHLKTGEKDPCAYALEMRYGQSAVPLTLRISPVTGKVSISPATPITIDTENKLNSDPSLDAGQILSILQCRLLQDQIRKHAQRLGWLQVPIGKQDDPRKIFGGDVMRWSVFIPREWGNEWAIAVTLSMDGEKWWIVQVETNAEKPTSSVKSAEWLPLETNTTSVRRSTLMEIESKSIAQISFSNITKQLRQRGIQYELRQAHLVPKATASNALPTTTVVCINFSDLMQPKSTVLQKTWKAWCHEVLILTHHGMDDTSSEGTNLVTHVLKASLTNQASSSLATNHAMRGEEDADIRFSESGTCAIRLRTSFGDGLVALIEARLKRVERLNSYIRVARQAHSRLTHASIDRLVFEYQSEPSLWIELQFFDKAGTSVQLALKAAGEGQLAADANPHRRIQPLLQKFMASDGAVGPDHDDTQEQKRFGFLLRILDCTLPLLRGLSILEKKDASMVSIRGSAYAYNNYRLTYNEPLPPVTFDFTLQNKDGRNVWLVVIPRDKPIKNAELIKGLRRLWSTSGEGWHGLTTGAVAEISGIEGLLDSLDEVVREVTPKTEAAQEGGINSNKKTEESKHEVVVLD